MKRLILFLPLSLLACATTGTDHSEGRHDSARANHQHDHDRGEKDRDRWMWQQPRKVMRSINVTPGMAIADVGAGDGYFTFRLAEQVGDTGRIYANEIDRKALEAIENRCEREAIRNVVTILGGKDDPRLPESALDMVLMVNVFHLLDNEAEFLADVRGSLKPGGTLVLVQWDAEKLASEIPHRHEMPASDRILFSSDRLVRVVQSVGYTVDRIDRSLSMQNIFIFRPDGLLENGETQESRTRRIDPQ